MKHSFFHSFILSLFMSALVLGMASCGDGVNDGNEPEAGKPFQILINNITDKGATIQITPSDKEATYFWELVSDKKINTSGFSTVEEFVKITLDREIYSGYIIKGDREFLIPSEESGYGDLDPYKEYVVIVLKVDENNKPIFETLVYERFTTDIDDRTFSVGQEKYVYFSPGNLQFENNTHKWSFTAHQWDIVGKIHYVDTSIRDLFSWIDFGESPDLADWTTSNIENDSHTWRILSKDEWNYLIRQRENNWGLSTIKFENSEYRQGLILLPDRWKTPDGVSFNPTITKDWIFNDFSSNMRYENKEYKEGKGFWHNIYNEDEWKKMQDNGAIFLPAAGHAASELSNVINANWDGWYLSTNVIDTHRFIVEFTDMLLAPEGRTLRSFYTSVRLVRDVQ